MQYSAHLGDWVLRIEGGNPTLFNRGVLGPSISARSLRPMSIAIGVDAVVA
jgi:hypothetical protein